MQQRQLLLCLVWRGHHLQITDLLLRLLQRLRLAQLAGAGLQLWRGGSRLQGASALLALRAATIPVRAWQAPVFVADRGCAVEFVATATVPEAVGRQDRVVLLAGVFQWVSHRNTIDRRDLVGVHAPSVGKRRTCGRTAAGASPIQGAVPACLLRRSELANVDEISAPGVEVHVPHPEAVVERAEGQAGSGLHHIDAFAVVAVPIGEVLLLTGTNRYLGENRTAWRGATARCAAATGSTAFAHKGVGDVIVPFRKGLLATAVGVVVGRLVAAVPFGTETGAQIGCAAAGVEAIDPSGGESRVGVIVRHNGGVVCIHRRRIGGGRVVVHAIALAAAVAIKTVGKGHRAAAIAAVVGHVGPVHAARVVEHKHDVGPHLICRGFGIGAQRDAGDVGSCGVQMTDCSQRTHYRDQTTA